jgi:hypothetical protein
MIIVGLCGVSGVVIETSRFNGGRVTPVRLIL